MSLVDILLWAVLLAFAVKGFSKGLIREVCSLLGLVVGGWAAFAYSAPVGAAMGHLIHLPSRVSSAVAFLAILLALSLIFFLLGHLLTVILKIVLLGGINRIGGIVFGLLQGGLVLCVLLYFASFRPVPEGIRHRIATSATARAFVACGTEIVEGWRGKSGSAGAEKGNPD
ncbi:CvpA family protein [Geobacter pickeringii]|uniref:CvpA family protein n=1 Tax=Geobacter pickeringii TaxID=345632 RepID=UPI000691EBA4|nr:CvpA family protein [Geobacter pickeringii]